MPNIMVKIELIRPISAFLELILLFPLETKPYRFPT